MAIRREQFGEWKIHPVTQALHRDLIEALESLVGSMVARLEPNPHMDQYTRAFARATDAILNWQPEFLPENMEGKDDD